MSIIISLNKSGLFGVQNTLAYTSKYDLDVFSKLTKSCGNVVMGANTWKSLPHDKRPLPDRQNIIVTKNKTQFDELNQNIVCVSSIEDVFALLDEPCFIGGAHLLHELFKSPFFNKITKMYITEYDTFDTPENGTFLSLPTACFKTSAMYSTCSMVKTYYGEEMKMSMNHMTYTRLIQDIDTSSFKTPCFESMYLDAMRSLLQKPLRKNRNGSTYS